MEDVQRRSLKEYVISHVVDAVVGESKDCGIVARDEDDVFLFLPEYDKSSAEEMSSAIKDAVLSSLGVELEVGFATFPTDEVTLSELLKASKDNVSGRKNGRPVFVSTTYQARNS